MTLVHRVDGEALRVATLNLLFYPQGDRWRDRRPLVERELRRLRPDVIGFQEVNRSINQDYSLAGPERRNDAYGVYRASETVPTSYPRHWDAVVLLAASAAGRVLYHQVRRLTYRRIVQALGIRRPDGSVVAIINTHLHHPDGSAGRAVRLRQAGSLMRFVENLPRTDAEVLLGDLNAVPDEPALDLLFSEGFRSATREVGIGDPTTFPSGLIAPTIYQGPGACIDYVLVRGRATVRAARLAFDQPDTEDMGLYASDHRGLVADLVLR